MDLGQLLAIALFVVVLFVFVVYVVSRIRRQNSEHAAYCSSWPNCPPGPHGLYPATGGWIRLIPKKINPGPPLKPRPKT